MMTLDKLLDNVALIFLLNNNSLSNQSFHGTFRTLIHVLEMNSVFADAMNLITSPLRYACDVNGSLLKMGINLAPFARMKFLSVAMSRDQNTSLWEKR